MITLTEILAYMRSGRTFSLKVVAYDRHRHQGGHILDYHEARLAGTDGQDPAHVTDVEWDGDLIISVGRRPSTPHEQALATAAGQRVPNHFAHFTRNIELLQQGVPTGILKKVHIPLILEFNGDTEVVD